MAKKAKKTRAASSPLPEEALRYFRKMGAIGAATAAQMISPEQRSEIVRRTWVTRKRNLLAKAAQEQQPAA